MTTPRLAAFLIFAFTITTTLSAANGPLLVYDPSLPQEELPLWLAYLGGRTSYREKHKLPSPPSGEIISTFEEEVSARGVAAAFYSVMKSPRNPYWGDVAKVEKAGFLKQYVWIYLRRPSWPSAEQPTDLDRFRKWSAANLRNHRPETRGKLMVDKK
jgi:hypothetical protein